MLQRLNLSQEPQLMQLQSRCYYQLTEEEMPSKASKSMESQLTELRKAAKAKLVLLVLDGGQCTQQRRLCSPFWFS